MNVVLALACGAVAVMASPQARAQTDTTGAWGGNVEIRKSTPGAGGQTVIGRSASSNDKVAQNVKLLALLTADGQQIDQGLIWRVYKGPDKSGKTEFVNEYRDAAPNVTLEPGDYTINAAFGRAHITRRLTVDNKTADTETFILNAGGLRLTAMQGNKMAQKGMLSYAIYSDEREQYASRTLVMAAAKPNLIIRLNAGLYRIVSKFGDANAVVEADVTVEAGKLTESTVTHAAGRAMFKLVAQPGAEALPGTNWTLQTSDGKLVKESVGALPSHYLAPGAYIVTAKSAGELYRRSFSIADGDSKTIEVVRSADTAGAARQPITAQEMPTVSAEDLLRDFQIKSP